jgi:membrane protein
LLDRTTLLFQYYVDNFADYSLFYGALGTMVALLLWVQLISTIILLGVEIKALLMRRGELTKHKPDLPGTN